MLDAEGLQQRPPGVSNSLYVQRKPGSWKKETDGEATVNKHHARVACTVTQTTDAKSTDPQLACLLDMEAISPICRQLAGSRSYQPLAHDGRSAPPQSTFLKNTKAVRCGHIFATSSPPASTCCVWAHLSHLPAAFYPSFLLRTATHSLCRLQRKCLASAAFFYLHCTAPPPLL